MVRRRPLLRCGALVRTRPGRTTVRFLLAQQEKERLHLIVESRQTAESIKDSAQSQSVPLFALAERGGVRLHGARGFGVRSKTVCNDSASTVSISRSCMTSRPTTNCYRLRGKNS